MPTAQEFDSWYEGWVGSSAADDLVRRVLDLPPDLESTSLLGGAGLDEVVARLALREGQVLLDLACGRGGYGLEIARRTGCRLVGVDFSAVAIEHARQRSATAEFLVGDMTATGLDTASVDAVLIVDAFQFAEPKPDALAECHRVLVPGGRLVITCWQPVDAADERTPALVRELDLATQLPEAGFTDVEVVDKPEWLELETEMWHAALAADADGDAAMESMQEEARRVLARSGVLRRVFASAIR